MVDKLKHSPRGLWRTINEMLQPPATQSTTKLSADDFASFFRGKVANIRASTASATPPDIATRQVPPLVSFDPVSVGEVITLLNTTPSKSCCLDPIPTWLLKQLASHIAPVICHLCNLSMQSGMFPSQLKQARVLPLLKKATMDPDVTSSYRPISNLSYISKLVERIVSNRFATRVSNFDLFPVQQSAYRPWHSTETAVLSVHNALVRAIDNNQVSVLVLLDLSAAFDTVDHEILLSVLANRFGLSCAALAWFQSYLSDRTQLFVHAGNETASYPVDCSVPQGSVLGPLSFVAYTEDIVEVLGRHGVQSHFYADDTQLYTSCRPEDIDGVRMQLTACAADVARWCASRRLQLNANKTEAIWFGSRSNINKLAGRDCSLTIGAERIQPVTTARDLGVFLDTELSMKQHISKVAAACYYQLRRLRQIRRRIGQDIAVRLVLALVTSRLDYCNSVLVGLPWSTLEPLQRVQNSAARLIFELSPRAHVTPSLLQLHWLPVQWRIQFKLCVLMHAVHYGRCPAYLSDVVQAVAAKPSCYELRSADTTNYSSPRLRTKFGERAFSFAGPSAWNQLPADIRADDNSRTFKRSLKTHFFQLAFAF